MYFQTTHPKVWYDCYKINKSYLCSVLYLVSYKPRKKYKIIINNNFLRK